MGYEYYIHLHKEFDSRFKEGLIKIIKEHPLFYRKYNFDNKTRYEFRDRNNQNIQLMPNFEVILEDNNKIYILENGKRDHKIWEILKEYLNKNGGYTIEDLQE